MNLPVCILANREWQGALTTPHPCQHLVMSGVSDIAVDVGLNLLIILICISLMTHGACFHMLIYHIYFYIIFDELSRCLTHSSMKLFKQFSIFYTNSLSGVSFTNVFLWLALWFLDLLLTNIF